MEKNRISEACHVVIGGGIAGVTCVEHLCYLNPENKVILITASPLIKTVTSIVPLSKTVFRYDVAEGEAKLLQGKFTNLEIIYDTLHSINSTERFVKTIGGQKINYKYLCLCSGGIPKIIDEAGNNPRVLGIRDTDSVANLMEKLKNSRRLIVVGNGGIASELIYAIKDVEVIWVVKDKYISSTFIDPGAAEFFEKSDSFKNDNKDTNRSAVVKRIRYTEEDEHPTNLKQSAAALGPDWLKNKNINGGGKFLLKIKYQLQIKNIADSQDDWPLEVTLTNDEIIKCDLVISATGVVPSINYSCDKDLTLGHDGGVAIDWRMKTSVENIFSAGDVACAGWDLADHWFQMRLWSQAYQMGAMAAKSIHAEHTNDDSLLQDFCFELFTHTTKLFGYQVVLLGKYNGQGFGTDYEILIRTTPNMEYIKFVLVNNKLQGVILIGETGLEETCENLILNQIDLSPYGDDILNPDIDIEDYFD